MDETPKVEQPDSPPPDGGAVVEQGKATAWMSYLIVLWIVPLMFTMV